MALSSGNSLVDAEIVGTEMPGMPGTEIHGTGTVEVKIPSWVEVSHEELHLVQGQAKPTVWAEVRSDTGFPMKGYLPTWKVDNAKIVAIEPSQNADKSRAFLKLTPLAPGETYLTASHKDLAADILVVVAAPEAVAP